LVASGSVSSLKSWNSSIRRRIEPRSLTSFLPLFKAVIRHYSVPYIPFIPSLWTWPKEMVHSCVYMCPSDTIFHEKVSISSPLIHEAKISGRNDMPPPPFGRQWQ
jgi:hypothetical protein